MRPSSQMVMQDTCAANLQTPRSHHLKATNIAKLFALHVAYQKGIALSSFSIAAS
jgi:hypothetical protein